MIHGKKKQPTRDVETNLRTVSPSKWGSWAVHQPVVKTVECGAGRVLIP